MSKVRVSLSMLDTVVVGPSMDVKVESIYRKFIWLVLRELRLRHSSSWLLFASDSDPNILQTCSFHQGVPQKLGLVESSPDWRRLMVVVILRISLRALFSVS